MDVLTAQEIISQLGNLVLKNCNQFYYLSFDSELEEQCIVMEKLQ